MENNNWFTVFPALSLNVAQNYLVTDLCLETPSVGVAPASYDQFKDSSTGWETQGFLSPFQGLGAVPDDIKDLLPADCRAAFDQALDRERNWFGRWGDEKAAMCRREPTIDKAIVPYAMTL
ncbi:hypothetical protein CMQ_8134 [Grosmannia clavigera kw1407]|uniref:Uncharacterized protein n=1 Tax=Grosmannia clavigera (strain kw1407 / UAMH 11150) TaxID=655863 RepID=F0XL37_GROCL|nr:uncharacterized protein CMQ_8134 [Grosmannia clavigera kw1407]EFX01668.1 hypothetical protein CMQ_8134 [Grosmannia clavigera kw1407]